MSNQSEHTARIADGDLMPLEQATPDDAAGKRAKSPFANRPMLHIPGKEWRIPVIFMLCMTMTGLMIPLGHIGILLMLLYTLKNNRYDFIIQLMLFFGGYNIINEETLFVKPDTIAILVALVGLFIYRKPLIIKKALVCTLIYFVILVFIARFSTEPLGVQFRRMRYYVYFLVFIIPVMSFADRRFSILEFSRRLIPYLMVICIFMCIDCIILSGHFMIPNSFAWGHDPSRFWSPQIAPLSMSFPRVYPQTLMPLFLGVYPALRFFKLPRWMLAVVFVTLVCCRTFTVIACLLIVCVFFQGNVRKAIKYSTIAVLALIPLYFIDGMLPQSENKESALRLKSSVDQFTNVSEMKDDEDLAEFASGRMAQVLPRLELLYSMHKEWTGFGFLHPELTTNRKYFITNEYYSDISNNEEIVAEVEVSIIQVFIDSGYLGLIAFFAFWGYLCFIIRRLRYSGYFYCLLTSAFIIGMAGWMNLSNTQGQLLAGFAWGIVILANKESIPGFHIPAEKNKE